MSRRWVQGSSRSRAQGGRPAGEVWWLSLHLLPSISPPPQELSKREVVPVRHLEVPAEVAGLLQAAAGASSLTAAGKGWGEGCDHHMLPPSAGLKPSSVPRVAIVRTPRLQTEPCVTLPLDINNYPMAKFIRCHFKVRAGTSSLAPGH